jgi:hypothetical protein
MSHLYRGDPLLPHYPKKKSPQLLAGMGLF